MIILNYTLGVYPAYNGTVAKLSQYDSDFTLVFTLTNDYGEFVLESGTTAQIRGTKADGNGYSANCAIDIAAQTVTVTGDEQLTAAAGDNTFEIRLIKDGKILNTVNFIIWVERAALDAGTITSESVLLDLTAIIESADAARQAATDAAASAAEAATSAATLRLDPTLTKSGESADAKVVGDALVSGLAARYDSASPYAVGDYFLKDNILFRVTKAIPAGGAVTVGTNVNIVPLSSAIRETRAEVDALNSNLAAVYSGTVSFMAIDPIVPNNSRGIGAWLDAKVHAQISTFSTGSVHSAAGVNDSVAYGALFFKASDSYYAGIIWGYHNNARNTAWYFKHSNGTYILRPLAKPISV